MANSMRIGFTLSNFEEMRQLCTGLAADVESRVMADAVKVAAKPIVDAAKAKAPVRSGALRRSITAVVKRYPKAGKVVAFIGPDTGFYGGGRKLKKGADRRGADRPANYAHLVEFGHYSGTRSGKFGGYSKGSKRRIGSKLRQQDHLDAIDGSFVRPQPFLRPAVMTAAAAAHGELARGVEVGMEREIRRRTAKMKKASKTS